MIVILRDVEKWIPLMPRKENVFLYLFTILKDEKKPMVVRLWYCDIGIRGNMPNWTVREKLLDKFLVGGKPVPDRVLDVSPRENPHYSTVETLCFLAFLARKILDKFFVGSKPVPDRVLDVSPTELTTAVQPCCENTSFRKFLHRE